MWVECEGVLGVSWRVKLGGGDWDPEGLVRVGSLWRMSEAWEWMSWVVLTWEKEGVTGSRR